MALVQVSNSYLLFWSEFIELYRNLPILWSSKLENGTSRKHHRDHALYILLRKYRKNYPAATVGDIKKLLKTLRFEYRAELQVALAHQKATGSNLGSFESSLWYFDALSFLLPEEIDNLKAELQLPEETFNECPTTSTHTTDSLPNANTSDTDIVHYCKSLATVMKLLSPQQLVYAKYHIDSILKCGTMGILNFDWPQIDINSSEQASGDTVVEGVNCENSTNCSSVIIPFKRFKAAQDSCKNVENAIAATMREATFQQISLGDGVAVNDLAEEYLDEYKPKPDEVNDDSYSSSDRGYVAAEGDEIDSISNSVTPFEISIVDWADAAGVAVTKRSLKSVTQGTDVPDENGCQAANVQPELILRRQCTVHYSNYTHNVVPHYNDEEFLLNFRMGRNTVQMLYNHLAATSAYRKLRGHGGYEAISPQTHVLAFLWFLGHDKASYRDVADQFSLSVSCLHSVICRVADAILSMKPAVMIRPNEGKKEESAAVFATMCNISDVIGCVGGIQIKIDKPAEHAERYLLWKGHHSIQLQAIIDENVRFLDVFVNYPDEPELMETIKDICGERYCLLGTAAYPCLYQLLVPYRSGGIPLSEAQKTFNEQLETITNKCVRIFAHLKTRFRQLYHLKGRHLSRIVKLVKVCCILHNLASAEEIQVLARNESENHRELVFTYDNAKHHSQADILHGQQRRDRICTGCM